MLEREMDMLKRAAFNVASFIKVDNLLFESKKKRNYSTVLSIHRISDESDFFWPPIKVKTFKKLLEYCARRYEITHLAELEKAPGKKPKLVLSFDDGYSDFVENAIPEMARLGLPSNHNVIIDCVEKNEITWTHDLGNIFLYLKENNFKGFLTLDNEEITLQGDRTNWMQVYLKVYYALLLKNKPDKIFILRNWRQAMGIPYPKVSMMNWNQVASCLKNDVEIGSHTVSHHTLSSLNDPALLDFEVTASKEILEKKLGITCETIAVPNGRSNKDVVAAASAAGYKRLLLVTDQFHRIEDTEGTLKQIARINLVEEPFHEILLRIEGFHNLVKSRKL